MKHNITSISLAILAVVAIAAIGCSKLKDANIRQNYYVNFTNGLAAAAAHFTTSDSKSRQTVFERERVRANGLASNANMVAVTGAYAWNLDSATEVTFTLELKNKTLTNTFSKSAIVNAEIVVDSAVSVDDTIRVSWTGNPLQAGEVVNVAINRNYDSVATTYYGTSGGEFRGEGYVFDFAQTHIYPKGTYTITMIRQKTFPLQQSDNGAGGEISASIYTSKTVVLH